MTCNTGRYDTFFDTSREAPRETVYGRLLSVQRILRYQLPFCLEGIFDKTHIMYKKDISTYNVSEAGKMTYRVYFSVNIDLFFYQKYVHLSGNTFIHFCLKSTQRNQNPEVT